MWEIDRFKLDSEVYLKTNINIVGVVVGLDSEEQLIKVKWKDNTCSWIGFFEIELYSADKFAKIQKIQKHLNDAAAHLEDAFLNWQAAQAEVGGNLYDLKYEDALNMTKFERAVEKFGWSTSSLYC